MLNLCGWWLCVHAIAGAGNIAIIIQIEEMFKEKCCQVYRPQDNMVRTKARNTQKDKDVTDNCFFCIFLFCSHMF